MLLQTLNPWLQPSLIMNCHFSATSNKLRSDRKSAAEEFPLCSHTTRGMYLTELELGLPGQLMPLNHSTIHTTHCCPVHTLLLGSPDVGVQMSYFVSKIGHLDPTATVLYTVPYRGSRSRGGGGGGGVI